jgi:CHAT domain-containing protein
MRFSLHFPILLLVWSLLALFLPASGLGQTGKPEVAPSSPLQELIQKLKKAIDQSDMEQADSLIRLGDQQLASLPPDAAQSLEYKATKGEYLRYNSRFVEALQQHKEVMQLSAGKEAHALRHAYALFYAALTFERLGSYDSSLRYAARALPHFQEQLEADDARFSGIYNGIGACYYRANRSSEAETFFLQAKTIAETSLGPHSPELANCLSNLSSISREKSDYPQAIRYSEQALAIYRTLGDQQGISSAYYSLGVYHYFLGDYGRTKDYMEACLEIRKQLFSGQHFSLIGPYEVLGIAHEEAGNYRKTLQYLTKGREIIRANFPPQSLQEGFNYDNTALCYQSLDELDSALYFVQMAEPILSSQLEKNDPALSNHYFNYANILYQLGALDRAQRQLDRSNRICQAANLTNRGEYAQNLSLSGLILAARGHWPQAEKAFDQALAIHNLSVPILEKVSTQQLSPDLFTLLNEFTDFLFQQYQATQNPVTLARFEAYSELYLGLSDRFRKQFSDPYTKSIFIKDNAAVYDRNIGIYFQLYQQTGKKKYLEAAYHCAEFGRTCLLRDLQDEKIESYAGLPDSVLQEERRLKRRLTQLNQRLLDDPEDAQSKDELFSAREALDDHLEYTLSHYPGYYALTYQSQIPSLADLQNSLQEGENLVEYLQDDTAYYALVVHPKDYEWVYVGNRQRINAMIQTWKNGIMLQKKDSVRIAGIYLYQQLWRPFASFLEGEQISIVPVGPLFFLSFGTLITNEGTSEYLIEQYALAYALSVSVLLSEEGPTDAPLMLAIAPGFEDEIKQQYREQLDSLAILDEAYMRTIRQPWSVKLVKQLQRRFALKGYTGQAATESQLKADLPQGQVLYFGTHAVANSDDPLRSKLILAKERGPQIEDGYLHAYELFGLPLQAELAILNACETGLGNLQRGEGMISLAYSIHAAGCPSTVMSLWKVDEKISTRLTTNFLSNLDQGLSRSQALRQAKLAILRSDERGLHHPFYWGGMVLMGKDGSVALPGKGLAWYVWLGIGGLLVLVVIGLLKPKNRKT